MDKDFIEDEYTDNFSKESTNKSDSSEHEYDELASDPPKSVGELEDGKEKELDNLCILSFLRKKSN